MEPAAPSPDSSFEEDDARTAARGQEGTGAATDERSHSTQKLPALVPVPGADAPAPAPANVIAAKKKKPRARRCPTCEQVFSGEARFCPFDGDALVDAGDWNPSADPLLGKIIDSRYEVISVIGEGGMGTVYEVRHTTLGRRFALKVLRRDLADAEHTARFIQEAKAAAAIGHPNIVAVSDFGELVIPWGPGDAPPPSSRHPDAAVPFFVMEYLTGISLASLLRAEKTLEPARAADIVLQCAAGLSAAHAAGVIHRDLKPDNIFLTRSGDREFVKLLDFGVAKMAGAGRLTRAGMVFGTPHYMSPEQAAGQGVDHRADIYALGIILYETLAGKVPFEADTYMGVLTKHMFATPEPIERIVPDASNLGALGPIVMRCLAKSPHDRYASMAEVVSAIEGAMAEAGIPGLGRRSERVAGWARRGAAGASWLRPAVGIGLGALAVALVVVMSIRELRGGSSSTEKPGPGTITTTLPPPATLVAETAETSDGATSATPPASASNLPALPGRPETLKIGVPVKPRGDKGKRPPGVGDIRDPWNK
jgi:serine/threonine-protein kinase